MDFQKEMQNKNKGIERIILLIYSIYDMFMIIKLFRNGMSYSSCALLLLLLGAAWVLVVKQFYTFANRSLIITLMIQFSILLYAFRVRDFYMVLPVIYLFSCVVSFYGINYYILLSTLTATVYFGGQLLGYHLNPQEYLAMQVILRQFLNVLGFEIILAVWTTGRVETEKKMKLKMESLQKQVVQQFSLIGIIGSKLQEPLHQIRQESIGLREESDVSKLKTGFGRIQESCDNILERAATMTDYSAIQRNDVRMQEKEYDIVSLADGIMQSAMLIKQMSNVEFIFKFDGSLPKYMLGDIEKIRRVILQLLGNAFRFTGEGFVGLTIGGRKESYGYNLMITIRDSGIGMTQEEIEHIISNREEALYAQKKSDVGVGIGLFVCKKLVEKMGGTMIIKSEVDKGTEVQVVIPQKILDDTHCITVSNERKVNALIYINMEQFRIVEVRDAYMEMMTDTMKQLPMGYQMCRNLSEMKRRAEGENYSHIVITNSAYHEDEAYFDQLSVTTKVVILMDRDEEIKIDNNRVYYVYKPFFVLSIVMVLWDIVEPNNYLGKRVMEKELTEQTKKDDVVIDKIADGENEPEMKEDTGKKTDETEQEKAVVEQKKEQSEKMTEKTQKETTEEKLVIGDLDIKTATLYCGGEKSFLMILKQFILKSADTRAELVHLYETQDWKNYVIKVHGLKSSMLSLGAKQLSEQAKELEYAGKAEKYDLIQEKMDALLAEFDRVIEMASAYPAIAKEIAVDKQKEMNAKPAEKVQVQESKTKKEAISGDDFAAFIDQMEEYSYELNEDEMTKILEKLYAFSYRGQDLEVELKIIKEKIAQSDFMSAVESMRKAKEKLDEKEGV